TTSRRTSVVQQAGDDRTLRLRAGVAETLQLPPQAALLWRPLDQQRLDAGKGLANLPREIPGWVVASLLEYPGDDLVGDDADDEPNAERGHAGRRPGTEDGSLHPKFRRDELNHSDHDWRCHVHGNEPGYLPANLHARV